jgi:bifunctional DNA-binding transcriptional regulator/antitoxin component of YhaV-PrlF toxin-antitoxin module
MLGDIQMESTGIIRKIFNKGRFNIPRQIMKSTNIKGGTELSINISMDGILIEKSIKYCIACREKIDNNEYIIFKRRKLCLKCYAELKEL